MAALVVLGGAQSAWAATKTWASGGTANWSVGGNWGGTVPATSDALVFGNTTGTTTLNNDLTTGFAIGSLTNNSFTFNAGSPAYTIGGNDIELRGNITNSGSSLQTINLNMLLTGGRTVRMTIGGGNITLGGNLSGTNGMILTDGAGTLTLSGSNSFTGFSTAVASNPAINVGLVINSSQTVILGSNTAAGTGAIEFTGGINNILAAVSGGVTISNGMVTNNTNGTIGGGGDLTVNGLLQFGGSNTLTINNNTTFAGGVHIRDSTASTRNAVFAGSGATLINSTIANGFTGAVGSLIYQGTGTLTLSGPNTYTGSTTVSQGTLIAGTNSAVSANGAFGNASNAVSLGSTSFSGAAAILTNGAFTIGRAITETASATNTGFSIGGNQTSGTSVYTGNIGLTATTTLTSAAGGEVDFTTGAISGAGINVVIGGGGTIKLTGANTFGSATAHANSVTIQGGTTLNLASATSTLGGSGNDLVFNNGTLQFAAGFDPSASRTMVFQSGATFDTNGNAITFASAVGNSGTGGLTLNDSNGTPGSLTLAAVNTYSGGTTVTKGTLKLSGGGTLGGTSGTLTVNTNGNLDLNGTNQSVGNLTGSGGTIFNNSGSGTSTLTIGNGNATGGTFAGVIANNTSGSGAVALTKTGSGTITLTGVNTYSGGTAVNGGTLLVGGAGGTLGATAVTIGGGTLQIGTSGSTITTVLGTGAGGSVTVNSGGTLSLSNGALNGLTVNSNSGGTGLTFSSGILSFDVGGGLADQITFGSGVGVAAGGTTTVNLTLLANLTGGSQQLIAGDFSASGTTNFALGSTTNTSYLNGYTLSLRETGTGLWLDESSTSSAYWKGGTSSSWAAIGNFTTDAGGTSVRSNALDSSTNVIFNATGAANFSTTTLDGSYVISGLAFAAGGVAINNGGGTNTLTIATGAGITVNSGLGAVTETIGANVVLGSTQTWTVTDAASTLAVSGTVSGSGSNLTKSGSGTLVLSGTNSYSGSTGVTAGILNIQSGGALAGSSGVTVSGGAALQLQGTITTTAATPLTLNGAGVSSAGALENVSDANTYSGLITLGSATMIGSDAGSLTLSNTGTISGSGYNLTLTGAGNGSLAGIIGTGSGSLTKSGNGTWTLGGANTYGGGTTVTGGTLALTGAGTLGSVDNSLTVNTGGTLDLGGTSQTVGNFTGTGGTVAGNGGSATLVIGYSNGTGGNFAGALTNGTGTLALTKTGTGILTVSGTNVYGGATTISAGALNLQSNGAASGSGIAVTSGAALQLSGGITTTNAVALTLNGAGLAASPIGALESVSGSNTYTGLITLGSDATISSATAATTLTLSHTGTITGAGFNLTLTGAGNGSLASMIGTGAGALVKNGSGTWTLGGANTYGGATTVNAGTLVYNLLGCISNSSAINLGSGGNAVGLTYGGAGGTFSTALNLTGTGSITLGNSGSGAIVYGAVPMIGAGTKTIVLGNATDAIGGSIGGIVNGSSGTTSLTKAGLTNSTWILAGSDTYTGTTLIAGGVLQDTSLSDLSTTYVNINSSVNANLAVLQTNGTIARMLSGTSGPGNLAWGAGGGFAAKGGTLTLNLSGGAALNWGTGSFMGAGTTPMVFGSATSDNQVELQNSFDFGATTATLSGNFDRIFVADGTPATIAGGTGNYGVSGNAALISGTITANTAIVGTATNTTAGDLGNNGFKKTGSGTMILSGANTYSGPTTVVAGTLVAGRDALLGTAGAFGDGHTVTQSNLTVPITIAGTQAIVLGNSNINGTDGTAANGASPTIMIGGAYTVALPVTIANIATTGTYGIGGSTANAATFSGLVTASQNFKVTQVAGGTLDLTGGITGGATSATKTVTFDNVGAVNVATTAMTDGAGGGKIALTKTNVGTLTLGAANTYTGATTVNGGTLMINGSTGTGSVVTVSGSGSRLAGGGTVGGNTTINSAAILAPGNGVGSETFTNALTLGSGSLFEWELNATNGADPGAGQLGSATYDKVIANGAVTGTSVFTVVLGSNNFANAFWDTNKTWTDVFTGGGTFSFHDVFTTFGGTSVATDGTVAGRGQFIFTGNALNWTAVPEPSGALAGLLLGAGLLRRRRNQQSANHPCFLPHRWSR